MLLANFLVAHKVRSDRIVDGEATDTLFLFLGVENLLILS